MTIKPQSQNILIRLADKILDDEEKFRKLGEKKSKGKFLDLF
jgi:hypothetical protein